jgi:pseudaminic acid biosynthesis-associated methylase
MGLGVDQLKRWKTGFGETYTRRNTLSLAQLNRLYRERYGISRTQLNRQFLAGLDRSLRILEVGTNIGNQLICLKAMGFSNLFGLEPQPLACGLAKRRLPWATILEGDIFDIPFKDGYFDLVFTSGVLIHIHPRNLPKALTEIYRCSRRFIWGFEYYSERHTPVSYRGEHGLLWKADFAGEYRILFPGLKPVKTVCLQYSDSENRDAMFLLKK